MPFGFDSFIFEDFIFDENKRELLLRYSFDSEIFFEDRTTFLFEFDPDYSREALQNAIFALFIALGASYFKADLPSRLVIKKGGLNKKQKEFFDEDYTNSLGQFFYLNNIDPRGKVNFPISETSSRPVEIPDLRGSLVAFGGGKDSIVTAEILKEAGENFDLWSSGYFFAPRAAKVAGNDLIQTFRKVSPNLKELNSTGAFKGRPFSAFYGFLSVIVAILRGRENIIFSNEHSADEENATFCGYKINHQYCKSSSFEKAFQDYIHSFISPSLHYFSFLRPLYELKISELFCRNYFDKYRGNFSSCNVDYDTNAGPGKVTWCGKCPKCAFIFLAFSSFLPKEKLVGLFGKNLFEDRALKQTFEELYGLSGIKPFECVGEIDEARYALWLAKETGNFPELGEINFPKPDFDHNKFNPHAMPPYFESVLKKYLSAETKKKGPAFMRPPLWSYFRKPK